VIKKKVKNILRTEMQNVNTKVIRVMKGATEPSEIH